MKKYFSLLALIIHSGISILLAQQDGTLDATFNNGGIVTTPMGTANAQCTAMAIQADGKILLTGSAHNGNNNDFGIVRYLEDGTLDTDFNLTGKLQIDFNGEEDFPNGLAVRPSDKKIIVGGYTFNGVGFDFAITQYLEDGTPDPFFGNNGKVTSPLGTTAFCKALTLQDDGRIVAAGYSFQSNNEFVIIRYHEDGTPDESFNDDGIVITPVGSSSAVANCLLIQPDHKILVAGQAFNDFTLRWEAAIVRYLPNGSLDESFNDDGKVTTSPGNKDVSINAIARDTDGKIILAGFVGTSPSNNNFIVFRYFPDGRLDSVFGENGILITPFTTENNLANALLIQPDHKIIVAGTATIGGLERFAMARYDVNGTPDPTFGDEGKVNTIVGNFADINNLAFDRQGRIVASGSSFNGIQFLFTTARYHNDLSTGIIGLPTIAKQIIVHPNPVAESFQLHFSLEKDETLTIQLLDLQGRILATYLDNVKTEQGEHVLSYAIPSTLPAGNYVLSFTSPYGVSSVQLSH